MAWYQGITTVEPIELADFLLIAEAHTGIDAGQLARMDRVVQLAESALAAPFAGYGDVELHPTFVGKAAIYASRLVRNHPLPDGNKRTAYDVMVEFIERNGYTFAVGLVIASAIDERCRCGSRCPGGCALQGRRWENPAECDPTVPATRSRARRLQMLTCACLSGTHIARCIAAALA
jgi:death-on-curing protein